MTVKPDINPVIKRWNLMMKFFATSQLFNIISLRIAFIYIVISSLWILFTDRLLYLMVNDKKWLEVISMVKGWLFVLTTGAVIYALITSALKEIKTAEEILQKSEAKYQNIFENIYDLYIETSLEGVILQVSPSVKVILGYTQEELLGTNIKALYFRSGQRREMLDVLVKTQELTNYEIIFRDKKGSRHYLWHHVKLVSEAGEQKIIGVSRDVTQYVEAKLRQQASEERYKLLFDKMLNGFYVLEPVLNDDKKMVDLRFIGMNPAVENHSPVKVGDDLGKTWSKVYGFANSDLDILQKVLRTGSSERFESYNPKTKRHYKVNAFLMKGNQIGTVFDDITDIKKNEAKYRNIFENIQDIYFESSLDGVILQISPSVQEILGYMPEELLGTSIYTLYFKPEQRGEIIEALLKNQTITNHEILLRDKQGRIRYLWLHAKFTNDPGEPKVIGVGRDVTQFVEAKLSQQESEERYKQLFDKMLNGFIVFEPVFDNSNEFYDLRYIDVNPAFDNQAVLKAGDVLGRTLIEANGIDNWQNIYKKILDTGSDSFEIYNPKSKRYYKVNAFLMKNSQIGAVFDNITDIKNAELEIKKINQELEQRVIERTSQLQAALNEMEAFTYTVSHDLKSPLRAIEGYSRFITEDYGAGMESEEAEMVGNIRTICSEMIALINKLLDYSTTSKAELNKERINLNDMTRSIFSELKSALPERNIELTIVKKLPEVLADRILLRQVFSNLLTNAFKFTRLKEQAKITVGYEPAGKEHLIFVKDNGAGFEMEYAGKLFVIFQRLHSADEFEGSGIGLATVRKIIQKHGGRTWIEGMVNEGATVYFTLPVD